MRRIVMLVALAAMMAAAMALSGVAQAAISPRDMCKQAAQRLTGKTLTGYTFVVGTADSNTFTNTNGRDEVFCGFDGDDHISHLKGVDIFNGAAGDDYVQVNRLSGTFNGGDSDDSAWFNEGTFYGGKGPDTVMYNENPGFNYDATYHGGDGNDTAWANEGTFDGGDGNDSVDTNLGGTFYGGWSNDYIDKMFSGVFDGGPGWDGIGTTTVATRWTWTILNPAASRRPANGY